MSKSNDTSKLGPATLNDLRELTAAELDEVTGGFFGRLLSGSGGGLPDTTTDKGGAAACSKGCGGANSLRPS
jgi:hypothetical protein